MECNSRIHKCTGDEMDFIHIMAKLMERFDDEQMTLVATVARQIWFRRNSVVFGGEMVSPVLVVRHAKEQVEAWCSASKRQITPHVVPAQPSVVCWTKPPVGFVKINWDASVNRQQKQMGAGVVARDSDGGVLAMHCITKNSITSPSVAETVGAWAAVELALRLDLRRVIFEGDALEIIQALTKEGDCWAIYGQTLNAIKVELARQQGWLFHVWLSCMGRIESGDQISFKCGGYDSYFCVSLFLVSMKTHSKKKKKIEDVGIMTESRSNGAYLRDRDNLWKRI
jgi:hypothetical protein